MPETDNTREDRPSRPRVGLFVTCLVDLFRPNVGFAAVKLLEDAGCTVEVPTRQVCCGQPAYNSGDAASARRIAKQVIETFAGFDYVVGPSGSCMATIRKDYPEMLQDDPAWSDRACDLAERSHELVSFLTDVRGVCLPQVSYPGRVTYHDSCSGLRALSIKTQPRQLMSQVDGLELCELQDAETCCGFGGTFCVKYPEISVKMVSDKVGNIEMSGADTLLGGDLGCLLNMAGRLRRLGKGTRVFHVAEVLAGMAGGFGIGESEESLMHAPARQFHERATDALADASLQQSIASLKGGFVAARARSVAELPEFEAMREAGRAIKDHTLANLDYYLTRYEAEVVKHGGHVHWARDAEEACRIVRDICARVGAKTVTKGKSMVSEEIGLNEALEADGLEVIETDAGEYIVQLAKEAPSHIVMPTVHKTTEQIADLFFEHHRRYGFAERARSAAELIGQVRSVLREKFFAADVGITGANFLVAENGCNVIVTNEGNGDLTSTLARVHIVTAGIEKVVPTLNDTGVLLRLLTRSALGMEVTSYTTYSTGPRRPEDIDGPEEYHVVLIDNGRTKMPPAPTGRCCAASAAQPA